jgi:Regulator of chromosome condensation (RCC1) repeat
MKTTPTPTNRLVMWAATLAAAIVLTACGGGGGGGEAPAPAPAPVQDTTPPAVTTTVPPAGTTTLPPAGTTTVPPEVTTTVPPAVTTTVPPAVTTTGPPVPAFTLQPNSISAGAVNICALTASNQGVKCWGKNNGSDGSLGNNSSVDSAVPVVVVGPAVNASTTFFGSIAVGGASNKGTSCATSSGSVFCWGSNNFGQLGVDSTVASPRPEKVLGLTNAKAVSVGDRFACAVVGDPAVSSDVFCWGTNNAFQLSVGVLAGGDDFSLIPRKVSQISNNTLAVSSGNNHTCIVNTTGVVHCWGSNSSLQLGSPASSGGAPRVISGFSAAVKTLSAGASHTCAALVNGGVACWGDNATGQLGDGTTTDNATPVSVPGITDAVAVASGKTYSCALRATGAVLCWGQGLSGQLGSATTSSPVPVAVQGLNDAVAITAHSDNTCALRANKTAVCWGKTGLLGSVTTANSNTPVEVTGGAIFGR